MTNAPILLVEDNADDEELTIRAFKKSDIKNEIVVARDGAEALDYLLGTGAHAGRDLLIQPALVLLDLKLPKIDGHGVLRRMREDDRTNHIPVVVMTSSKEDRDVRTSYHLGGNSFIRKPLDFGEFAESVRVLGQYWLTINQLPLPGGERIKKPTR